MGISFAAAARRSFSSAVKPVVPITMALPARRQISRFFSVTEGWVKSISTSNSSIVFATSPVSGTPRRPMPASSPASAPTSVLSGRSTAAVSPAAPAVCCTASIRILPMRPAAPITAIRRITQSSKLEAESWKLARRTSDFRLAAPSSRSNITKKALYAFEPTAGLGRVGGITLKRATEFLEHFTLALAQIDRRLYRHPAQQIPRRATTNRRHTLATQAELLTGLRSEEHTSELQSRENLVCRLLREKKNL